MWYLLKLYEEGKEVMAELNELKQGDKGYQVVALQKILNEHFATLLVAVENTAKVTGKKAKATMYAPLKIDGSFGPGTAAAVNEYRKSVGFIENGVCSYSTWFMLLTDTLVPGLVEQFFEFIKVI